MSKFSEPAQLYCSLTFIVTPLISEPMNTGQMLLPLGCLDPWQTIHISSIACSPQPNFKRFSLSQGVPYSERVGFKSQLGSRLFLQIYFSLLQQKHVYYMYIFVKSTYFVCMQTLKWCVLPTEFTQSGLAEHIYTLYTSIFAAVDFQYEKFSYTLTQGGRVHTFKAVPNWWSISPKSRVCVVSTQSALSAMNNDSGVHSSDVQDKSMRLGLQHWHRLSIVVFCHSSTQPLETGSSSTSLSPQSQCLYSVPFQQGSSELCLIKH